MEIWNLFTTLITGMVMGIFFIFGAVALMIYRENQKAQFKKTQALPYHPGRNVVDAQKLPISH